MNVKVGQIYETTDKRRKVVQYKVEFDRFGCSGGDALLERMDTGRTIRVPRNCLGTAHARGYRLVKDVDNTPIA